MFRNLLSCILRYLILLSTISWSFSHDLNMPQIDSVLQNNVSFDYTKILSFWKEHKNEFVLHGNHKEVVLVMGNTGAGKTTLVSALIGRNLRVTKSNGYLIFVDEEGRIGTGISSTTLVPEVMIDHTNNITYVDCSGFRDNRNVEYQISSLYFQNILMNQVEKIKLILVINYDSLKMNGNKNDFDDLFEHVGEFIKDISKFHDGIELVVTKVENTYELSDDGIPYLSNDNQSVLNGIADYLKNKKNAYQSKTVERQKYQMFVNLIDVLLQKNNNLYTRIAIFRQPMRQGLLQNLSTTRNEIHTIANMIIENLHYVRKQVGDFGFALSKSSKDTVDRIVDDIFRNALTNRLYKIGNETLMHYLQMEKQYNDIRKLSKQISSAHKLISQIQNVNKPEELFEEFLNVANTLNISVSLTNLNVISDDIKALRFFTTVSNNNEDTHMLFLKNETQNIINLMGNFKNFYDFLNNLEENLAVYNSQKLKNDYRLENIILSCTGSTEKTVENIPYLESIVKEIGDDQTYRNIKTLKLNRFELKHLRAVFSAFTKKLEVSCTSLSESMIVRGYNVRMRDVVGMDCWAQAKNIQIFALNKVFIDSTIDKTGAEVQLLIFAPTWEVVGGPKIILDGIAGEPHQKASAKSALSNLENGTNGLPGLPGGPAGNFFGVGKQFINSEFLEIRANGGKGGPGQHGGNGADGIAGEGLSNYFFKTERVPDDIKNYFKEHNLEYTSVQIESLVEGTLDGPPPSTRAVYLIDVSGKPAKKPSNGGNGGVGGRGGYPGRIIMNGLGKLINVKTSNNSGSTGSEGQGGQGGKGASEGSRVKFKCTYGYTFMMIGWYTKFSDIEWIAGGNIPAGKNGISGYNGINQKNPTTTTMMNLHFATNSYKDFLRINLFENIKESELRIFYYELENNEQIGRQYDTLAYIKEFEGLENQFLALRNKIDFVPFYHSFLSRVERYAKSVRTLENKKVLSYIYTAALTKLFTLKKKRKGQTVVNLPKYLDTIEKNVKEIGESYHLQIVQKYQDDYKNTLNKKIREANNFIQNTIEFEIDKLWDESDNQIRAIVNEINENINSTKNTLETLEKNRAKISFMMQLRTTLLPLKLATSFLSFTGPIGAGVGVAVTSLTTIAEGVLLDKTSSLGENKINTLDPNLKLMSRVTEVINNKHQLAAEKLGAAMTKLEDYEKQLSVSEKDKKRQIKTLKTQLQEATFRKTNGFSESLKKLKDVEEITKKMVTFTNSEKDVLEKKKEEEKKVHDLGREKKYEKRLRLLNDAQSILNSAEIVYSFTRKMANDEGMLNKINDQISDCVQELKVLEKMENQVYHIIQPDLYQIEETINTIRNSVNGSSHAKLDLTKWNVRTTLRDVKSLLQKFTRKMSFEVQSNLQRFMEKIDEGFSILIDIYDRIDSYSDSVKQAEYIAHIESASMDNIQVIDTELSKAVNDLKLIIHSNILTEKYEIALHAFKQHYFPFAAHVLQRFQLPMGMQLNDSETLRSTIIDKIKDMKNHIDESEATIGEYSKYIHRRKVFDNDTIGSSPFYVWKYDTIKNEIKQLLNGSEIILKADISKGLFYNAIKYNDIGINFKLRNEAMQNSFRSVLRNFALTLTMIGNNYYRCGEQYYFISFDDDITISYSLNQDGDKNWIDPNEIYTLIHDSHTFLSPYGMWSMKLQNINKFVSFDQLNVYANEMIDLELVGQGYYIEQNPNFNFEVCNEYLSTLYDVENIVTVLF